MKSNPPCPDEGPEPDRITPRRLAERLHRIGLQLTRIQLELRALAPYLERQHVEAPQEAIRAAAAQVVDLGSAVRVGAIALVPDYLDRDHAPERPLLDAIEARSSNGHAEAAGARPGRSRGRSRKGSA